MATRSTISVKTGKDEFKQIYCHWDGYPSNNGKILLEHYNTEEKALELIALGDLSSLAGRLTPSEGETHNFEKPVKGVCVAYGRDGGEEGTAARTTTLYKGDCQVECYNYVFKDGKWFMFEDGTTYRKGAKELTKAMCTKP